MLYSYEVVPEHEHQRWNATNQQFMQDISEGNENLPLVRNHLFQTGLMVERQAQEIKRLQAWLKWLARDTVVPITDVQSALAGCQPPKFSLETFQPHIEDKQTCPSTL